jgi:glycosyltransferase involved in cell wall biosynthesis
MKRTVTIQVDARCLQDDAYRHRGVGQHGASILAAARAAFAPTGGVRLTALLDRTRPELDREHLDLFDDRKYSATGPGSSDWFLSLSPMTHAPGPMTPMFLGGAARRAAILYDFIPLEEPTRYLPNARERADYLSALRWLSHYNLFQCISEHTCAEAMRHAPGSTAKRHVSGVAVRSSLIASRRPQGAVARHILFVGGGDARKNADCAVAAHGGSSMMQQQRIPLEIVGNYPEGMKGALLALHAKAGGSAELVRFRTGLSDSELASLYRDAVVTVCPSRTEGFSIPVVEANANGCPVIISNCPAQTELIPFPEDQFDPDDHSRVTRLIEAIAADPAHRAHVIARQKDIWRRFEAKAVGERFWKPFLETVALDTPARDLSRPAAPAIRRGAKPKIAFVTPLPPDKSGVADYTAACLQTLAKSADIHVFTETKNPTPSSAYAAVEPISPLPYLSRRYDAVVSVIGNSHFHLKTLDLLLDYGGAAIAHDARMINFYAILHGPERATAIAARELGRPVSWPEVERWLHNQRRLPTLFLSEILETASPTIVHSKVTQSIIQKSYGVQTQYIPFSMYRTIPAADCTPDARAAARASLGIDPSRVLISSFGGVSPDKAPEACVWALQQLRGWGVNADFAFVGGASPAQLASLRALADDLGLNRNLILFDDSVDEATFRKFLAASDIGIQLRSYGLGGLSGSLLDCIAAGLPTIANAHLAEAMDAPSFVRRTPDAISPVLIAESCLELLDSGLTRSRPLDEQACYASAHSLDAYASGLMSAVGLAR